MLLAHQLCLCSFRNVSRRKDEEDFVVNSFSSLKLPATSKRKPTWKATYLLIDNWVLGAAQMSETIEFPKTFVAVGNIALAAWIILDTLGILLINIAWGVAFLIILLLGVYGILKFLGCLRPCYNCKKCTLGMGRLAALYFGKRSLKDYKHTYHLPVAIFYYTLLGPLPVIILIISTVQAFAIAKVAILLCLIAFSAFSDLTWISKKS
jgi:hypothetical protein